jgi:hypothetical protein
VTTDRCTEATDLPAKLNTTEASAVWAKFAAGAMAGLCSAHTNGGEWTHGGPKATAKVAAEMADALLAEYMRRSP